MKLKTLWKVLKNNQEIAFEKNGGFITAPAGKYEYTRYNLIEEIEDKNVEVIYNKSYYIVIKLSE